MDLHRLNGQQAELLGIVDHWQERRLQFRPSAEAWSAADVFDHLEKTERAILQAARAGVNTPHYLGVRDRLGYLFVEKIFQTDRKVKVPVSARAVLPSTEPKIADVLSRWAETRDDLRIFHDALTPAQLRQGIFRHPVTGWMDMVRILRFFSVHMRHHAFQLERLRAASECISPAD